MREKIRKLTTKDVIQKIGEQCRGWLDFSFDTAKRRMGNCAGFESAFACAARAPGLKIMVGKNRWSDKAQVLVYD